MIASTDAQKDECTERQQLSFDGGEVCGTCAKIERQNRQRYIDHRSIYKGYTQSGHSRAGPANSDRTISGTSARRRAILACDIGETMNKRPRRSHTVAFKAKVTLAAIKGEKDARRRRPYRAFHGSMHLEGRARACPLLMVSKAGSRYLFCRASLSEKRFTLFRTHSRQKSPDSCSVGARFHGAAAHYR